LVPTPIMGQDEPNLGCLAVGRYKEDWGFEWERLFLYW
jgi:hypothetical protein